MDNTDVYEPIPIGKLVRGTLTLHFAGATVERRMTLAEARTINEMNDDERTGDQLTWSDLRWFQFASEKVLACDFNPDEDLGYGLTSDDRAALSKNGHPHGILRTLVDHWRTRGTEPSYSPLAVVQLSRFAIEGTSGDDFTQLIEALEGNAGRDLLQDAYARAEDTSTRQAPTSSRQTPPAHQPDVREEPGTPTTPPTSDGLIAEPGTEDDPNLD